MSNASKRYYLHKRLKIAGIKYNPRLKTIYLAFNQPTDNKYINRARTEFNYSVQLEIRQQV